MGTNHIIFIHGVHIRQSDYATNMINEISSKCPHLPFNFIPLFRGNVSDQQEDKLRFGLQNSSHWQKFWFRTFRETILLQFVGDIAYIQVAM